MFMVANFTVRRSNNGGPTVIRFVLLLKTCNQTINGNFIRVQGYECWAQSGDETEPESDNFT